MKLRKYRVITWGHWVYFAICAFAFATLPLVIFSSRAEPHQRWLSVAVLALFPGITWLLFRQRIAYGRSIKWYTAQGIAVLPGELEHWLSVRDRKLEGNIQTALRWWMEKYPHDADELEDALNGDHLVVLVQDEKLTDPRSGKQGRAFAEPGKVRIWYPHTAEGVNRYLEGYAGREVEDVFFALVRHETGHLCLYALGDQDEGGKAHHERMAREGCPDA